MNYQHFSNWTEPEVKDILLCYQNGLSKQGVGAVIKFNSKLAYRFFGREQSVSDLEYLSVAQVKHFNSSTLSLSIEEDPLGQQNLTIDSCRNKSFGEIVETFGDSYIIYAEVSRKRWSFGWKLRATIYPGVQGMSAKALLEQMENISELGYSAGWMYGLEYELWEVIWLEGEIQYGEYIISANEKKLLRFLVVQSRGWWQWSDGLGPVFKPLNLWLNHIKENSREINPLDLIDLWKDKPTLSEFAAHLREVLLS